jgi:hypothetical protein
LELGSTPSASGLGFAGILGFSGRPGLALTRQSKPKLRTYSG